MRVGATIEARMGSERLPGKGLRKIGRKILLDHIIDRAKATGRIDQIILAAPDTDDNDELEGYALSRGISCYRGQNEPVLHRLAACASVYGLDHIVRLSGDCPFYDVEMTRALLDFYLETWEGPHDASNVTQPFDVAWIHSQDRVANSVPRVIHSKTLRDAARDFEWFAEHVVAHAEELCFGVLRMGTRELHVPGLRLTVDEPLDLAFANAIALELGDVDFGLRSIVDLMWRRPDLLVINAEVHQRPPVYDADLEGTLAAIEADVR